MQYAKPVTLNVEECDRLSFAKWHLNRSQFGIRIDHDLASISDHSLASQSITIWHASDH
ncbi:YceI family protein [Escherichia coli]|uniref:YceI family protein n=1 Tax=Escherichia coli TaxID=562 RepID=UPI0013EE2A30|nr:YceI family protein [Escherichia coli]UZF63873.1 YceI family protein [Escherichia coli]